MVEVPSKIEDIKEMVEVPSKIEDIKEMVEVPNKIEDINEVVEVPCKIDDIEEVSETIYDDVRDVIEVLEKNENRALIIAEEEEKETEEPATSVIKDHADQIIEENEEGDRVTSKENVEECKMDINKEIPHTQNIETTEGPKELEKKKAEETIVEIFEQKMDIDKDQKDMEALDKLKSEEQAIIDDMNIQHFIDKNNELLYQGNGNVNDAFVTCEDEKMPEIPEIKDNHEKEPNKAKVETQENEAVRSAINAAETNVAKLEEAVKVQETNESAEDSDDSSGEGKSKPLMKSICSMCTVM